MISLLDAVRSPVVKKTSELFNPEFPKLIWLKNTLCLQLHEAGETFAASEYLEGDFLLEHSRIWEQGWEDGTYLEG